MTQDSLEIAPQNELQSLELTLTHHRSNRACRTCVVYADQHGHAAMLDLQVAIT
jgi:hypothetical protein